MRGLALFDFPRRNARSWPGLVASLARRAAPALAVARLEGGVLTLGRFQELRATLTESARATLPIRRLTSGRSLTLGDGLFACALVLPHRSWLVSDDPSALPTASLLNRAVRGMLAGLARLGIAASYGGRDFITADEGQAAYLTFEVDARGIAVVEAIFAAEAHWWPPPELMARPARPPSRGSPGPTLMPRLAGRTSSDFAAALARGFEERFGLTIEPATDAMAPEQLPDLDDVQLARSSPLVETPTGVLRAMVELDGARISRAHLSGDFLGDSAGLERFEQALVGRAPTRDEVLAALDFVYRETAHALLGAGAPELVAQAFVAAAESA